MIPEIRAQQVALAATDSMPQNITKAGKTFAEVIADTINQTNKAQDVGDKSIQALESGKAQNLHEVMISMEEADISLRMLVQVRNKALSAYDEIMRMQV